MRHNRNVNSLTIVIQGQGEIKFRCPCIQIPEVHTGVSAEAPPPAHISDTHIYTCKSKSKDAIQHKQPEPEGPIQKGIAQCFEDPGHPSLCRPL